MRPCQKLSLLEINFWGSLKPEEECFWDIRVFQYKIPKNPSPHKIQAVILPSWCDLKWNQLVIVLNIIFCRIILSIFIAFLLNTILIRKGGKSYWWTLMRVEACNLTEDNSHLLGLEEARCSRFSRPSLAATKSLFSLSFLSFSLLSLYEQKWCFTQIIPRIRCVH